MTRENKHALVDELSKEFADSNAVLMCAFAGMKVKDMTELRSRARKENIKVKVVKNTLAKLAFEKAKLGTLDLKENNVFVWGEDQIAVSKLVTDYSKDTKKEDVFYPRAGCIDGELVDSEYIKALSKMPSKDVLIGMLLSVWTAPMRNMASVLQAPISNLAHGLNNYKNTK